MVLEIYWLIMNLAIINLSLTNNGKKIFLVKMKCLLNILIQNTYFITFFPFG